MRLVQPVRKKITAAVVLQPFRPQLFRGGERNDASFLYGIKAAQAFWCERSMEKENYATDLLEKYGVRVREVSALGRHNVYAYMPVLRAMMELAPEIDRPSDEFPGFVERLTAWLPGLHTHACSIGRPGGFVERLRRGTYVPHI